MRPSSNERANDFIITFSGCHSLRCESERDWTGFPATFLAHLEAMSMLTILLSRSHGSTTEKCDKKDAVELAGVVEVTVTESVRARTSVGTNRTHSIIVPESSYST